MKGKWAQGIEPRSFHWIIKDQLAGCERPGGYGVNHRRVRRQEEIIWARENGFSRIVSLIPSPHNLHNYDELNVAWWHFPFGGAEIGAHRLIAFYEQVAEALARGDRLLIHREELSDSVMGLVSGYLLWKTLVPAGPQAITIVEHLVGRQMGPVGREVVALVERSSLVKPEDVDHG